MYFFAYFTLWHVRFVKGNLATLTCLINVYTRQLFREKFDALHGLIRQVHAYTFWAILIKVSEGFEFNQNIFNEINISRKQWFKKVTNQSKKLKIFLRLYSSSVLNCSSTCLFSRYTLIGFLKNCHPTCLLGGTR